MDRKSSTRRSVYQLVKEGQMEKAIESFGEFLASGEAGPYDFVYMGDLLLRSDRVADAIGRYEEAISAYARLGFNRNAIALCRKILRLDATRREIQRRLGDFQAAEEFVGDALYAYFDYLEGTEEADRQEEAFRETLQRIEELAPQRPDFAIRASDFCRKIERYDSAVSILMRAAQAADASGHGEQATDLRDRLAAVSPTMLGSASQPQEGFEALQEETPPVEASGPVEEVAISEAAAATTAVSEGEAPLHWGEVDLKDSSARSPQPDAGVDRDDFRTHYQRGVVFMEQGRLDEALGEFEAAARDYDLTSEQGAQLQETRGRCFSSLGRHREAIREFTLLLQSAGRKGDRAEGLVLLAREYEAVGEMDEAKRRLREALEVRPDFAEATGFLDQLEKRAA
ncbi:MAG: tetratricopeptide repeat protein [Candidatus Eisenbacteria bacterium]